MKTVVGLYENITDAQEAINDLVRSGFDRADISLVASKRWADERQGMAVVDSDEAMVVNADQLGSAVAAGMATGGVVGGWGCRGGGPSSRVRRTPGTELGAPGMTSKRVARAWGPAGAVTAGAVRGGRVWAVIIERVEPTISGYGQSSSWLGEPSGLAKTQAGVW